jgi:beta-galactosidase
LRWRTAGSAWLAAAGEGWQIGADGLLARRVVGNGVMLWSQIDPTLLPADEKTYFRFTRWRQTRALSQVLANLGASFATDEQFFSPRAEEKPVLSLLRANGVRSRSNVCPPPFPRTKVTQTPA